MVDYNKQIAEAEDRVRLADAKVRQVEKAVREQQAQVEAEQKAEADRVALIAEKKAEYVQQVQVWNMPEADSIRREIQALEAGTPQTTPDDTEKATLISEYLEIQRQIDLNPPSKSVMTDLRQKQFKIMRKINNSKFKIQATGTLKKVV